MSLDFSVICSPLIKRRRREKIFILGEEISILEIELSPLKAVTVSGLAPEGATATEG
jgi:hypothetical protein